MPTEVDVSDEFLLDAVTEATHRHHPLLLLLLLLGRRLAPVAGRGRTRFDTP